MNNKNEAIEKWEFIMSGELKKMQKELLGHADVTSLPYFKSVYMHKTRFSDLRFRLGAGYLYCHQVLPHLIGLLSSASYQYPSFKSITRLLEGGN